MKALVMTISLYGLGHIKRTQLLVEELSKHFDVEWILSGMSDYVLPDLPRVKKIRFPDPHIFEKRTFQIAPNHYKKELITSIAHWFATFEEILQGEYAFFMTESFPISKTNFDEEMEGILALFRKYAPSAPIYCSSKGMPYGLRSDFSENTLLYHDELMKFSAELIRKHYKKVFLHADPKFYKLDEDAPVPKDIKKEYLIYTGYVTRISKEEPSRKKKIVVACGSGLDVDKLFQGALEAAALMPEYRFKFLVGPRAEKITSKLSNVEIGPLVEDFQGELKTAEAAITQCGSSLLDLYATKTKALVYPSKASVDQRLMGSKFSALGATELILEKDLCGKILHKKLKALLEKPYKPLFELDLSGQKTTVQKILEDLKGG